MSWLLVHLETVILTLLALVAAVVILQQRRTPQSAVAWLLFIVVVPYVGIPLFLALGFRKRAHHFKPVTFAATGPDTPVASAPHLTAIFQHYDIPRASIGNGFRLLPTGESAYRELIDLCRSATTDLDALFYIVANDRIGRAFVDELTQCAQQGVRVRLLMDGLGNLFPPRAALAALREAGGQVAYFSPLFQMPHRLHLNLRNHRKMVIADNARVFAGGMNVGAEYMGPGQAAGRWVDLAYLLEGPAVAPFCDIFRSDWATAGGRPAPSHRPAPRPGGAPEARTAAVQLVPSGPDVRGDPLHDALVNAIHSASQRAWIVTPYFLPTEFLGNALAVAARRGVDVRILIPQKSNQHLADFARGAYLREMADAGATIQLFRKGMIHAKVGIIDDVAYVGSANFDIRSMMLNFETALFAYDPDSLARMVDWYRAQERHCRTGVPRAGHLRRITEGVFRLGAPVL
ncbi:MAG: PLDc N-terminal domain-containing protein [Rhodobacteraceae bacterium]|nr:PLDc N-terminal domain-containing protein [Paracoccaceae bacterium]MCP5341852.1 PLDc N-terminal domain-containing protein [Paracoccaceae bacterium]